MPDSKRGGIPLARSLGPVSVTIYGIGTIIGAGIFVLLGKLIGVAGTAAPWAFLLAALIAGLTGLSYAALAGRLPVSAGEAAYVHAAFGRRWLTLTIGIAVAASGILSAATIAHGFAGYVNVLLEVPATFTAIVYLLALGAIAIAGIRQTVWVVGVITISSTLGLIILAGFVVQGDPDWHWPDLSISLSSATLIGILLGAFLSFYALIGFEDLVNLAEEIKKPGSTLAIAIPASLIFASLLYIGLTIVALGAAPVEALAATDAPMAFLLDNAGLQGQAVVVLLSIVAITNGALAQLVMASRVLYGMSRQRLLPQALEWVHPTRRTPVVASLIVITCVVLAAWSGGILSLARSTSSIVLLVFALVNIALMTLNWKGGVRSITGTLLPALGAGSCLMLLLFEILRIAGLLEGH